MGFEILLEYLPFQHFRDLSAANCSRGMGSVFRVSDFIRVQTHLAPASVSVEAPGFG
jgi:hypothetical protein